MKDKMIIIDGSAGEGGGQVLRTSLALSLITGIPFRIANIRANRKKPGLLRQHLTALNAAATIGQAEVSGNEIGSREATFIPGAVIPGNHTFSVGTAGSATLVLQTVLPALITAGKPSHLILEGGTHNPMAPPYDFIEKVFIPVINKMGPKLAASIETSGFYPAGGGRFFVDIEPCRKLKPLHINERGGILAKKCTAVVALIGSSIAKREASVVVQSLGLTWDDVKIMEFKKAPGPGNYMTIEIESEHITEVFTGFGELGIQAEKIAAETVREAKHYIASNAPIGEHLADQLLLSMAIAGKGSFRTVVPTKHTLTNIGVIKKFLDIDIQTRHIGDDAWEIAINA